MGKKLYRYEDVDVVAFLEEKMKGNTVSYQADFEYDKEKIAKCVASERKEDKTLLWLSRPHGTQCVKEHDAFLYGTDGYFTWQYYAQQEVGSKYVAYAVELTGVQDGVIRGNAYELDYFDHAKMVRREAQQAYEVIKTFEDGHVEQAFLDRSSYGYWWTLVEEHGAVVDSFGVPYDKELHLMTLAEQKRTRGEMKLAPMKDDRSVNDILTDARAKAGAMPKTGGKENCKDENVVRL